MLQIILAQLIRAVGRADLFLFELLQLVQDLLHALDARLVLVVVAQHLEDDLAEGQSVLLGFEYFEFGGVPDADDVCIDGPDDVIEEVAEKGHEVFEDIDELEVDGLLGFDVFDDGCELVYPLQKFEYLARVLHGASDLMRHLRACIPPLSELSKHLSDLRILVAVVVEVRDILDDRADLVPALAGLHDHREGRDIGGHVLAVLEGYLGGVSQQREGLC